MPQKPRRGTGSLALTPGRPSSFSGQTFYQNFPPTSSTFPRIAGETAPTLVSPADPQARLRQQRLHQVRTAPGIIEQNLRTLQGLLLPHLPVLPECPKTDRKNSGLAGSLLPPSCFLPSFFLFSLTTCPESQVLVALHHGKTQ